MPKPDDAKHHYWQGHEEPGPRAFGFVRLISGNIVRGISAVLASIAELRQYVRHRFDSQSCRVTEIQSALADMADQLDRIEAAIGTPSQGGNGRAEILVTGPVEDR